MNKIDFLNYKFRASGMKYLMVKPRSKTEALSETTKSYLQELWIQEVFGRKKPLITPMTQKGTMVESESMSLVQEVSGRVYFKNNTRFENDFATGTPDIVDKEALAIRDIKSSWDLWTYAKSDASLAKKEYYWQVMTYMWLTGMKKGSIIFALVNTPEMLITDELYRLSFKIGEKDADEYRKNFEFNDIPASIRMREYSFDYNEEEVEDMKKQITLSRQYLSKFTL